LFSITFEVGNKCEKKRHRPIEAGGALLPRGLAMNWRDLLPLAARLAGGSNDAEWRSSVSRAYYAVFHDSKFIVPRADRARRTSSSA
jgi:hypothetical protein